MKIYLSVLAFVLLPWSISAQDNDGGLDRESGVPLESPYEEYVSSTFEARPFNEDTWRDATEGLNYSRKKKKKKKRDSDEEARSGSRSSGGTTYGGDVSGPMRVILIILGAILLAFLLAAIIGFQRGGRRNKKIKKGAMVSIADIEDNIYETELDDYIQQAIQAGDYRMAIRLYYLNILKELSLQKMISWKKDKTNRIYLWEMQKTPYFENFKLLTYLFDQVRYSGKAIQKSDFLEIEPHFKSFFASIEPVKTT